MVLARCASQYLLLFSSADVVLSKVFLLRKRRIPARDIWCVVAALFPGRNASEWPIVTSYKSEFVAGVERRWKKVSERRKLDGVATACWPPKTSSLLARSIYGRWVGSSIVSGGLRVVGRGVVRVVGRVVGAAAGTGPAAARRANGCRVARAEWVHLKAFHL
jgi:hypothetical protein